MCEYNKYVQQIKNLETLENKKLINMQIKNYQELKLRLTYVITGAVTTFMMSFVFVKSYLFLIIYEATLTLTLATAGRYIYTHLMEVIFLEIKISYIIVFFFINYFLIINFYFFIAKGLVESEQKRLKSLIIGGIILLIPVSMAIYYFVIPSSIFWIVDFNKILYFCLTYEPKLPDLIDFIFSLTFYILLIFTVSYVLVAMLLVPNTSVINWNILRNRKLFYTFFILISTVISPPDIITQIIFFLFFIALYELFLVVIINHFKYLIERQPKRDNF